MRSDAGSRGGTQMSPTEMVNVIRSKEAEIHAAAETILRNAGLDGVTIDAIHFKVAPNAMTMAGCEDCDLSVNNCVLTPGGWLCIPKQ